MEAPHQTRIPARLLILLDRRAKEQSSRAQTRRPDVTGYFTLALVGALASGMLVLADVLGAGRPILESLPFVLHHPMSLLFALWTALLVVLLAIGDV